MLFPSRRYFKIAAFYNVTIDDIVHIKKSTPKLMVMEDKTTAEQLRLMSQLNEKDKSTVMNIIDNMLTKQNSRSSFNKMYRNKKPAIYKLMVLIFFLIRYCSKSVFVKDTDHEGKEDNLLPLLISWHKRMLAPTVGKRPLVPAR